MEANVSSNRITATRFTLDRISHNVASTSEQIDQSIASSTALFNQYYTELQQRRMEVSRRIERAKNAIRTVQNEIRSYTAELKALPPGGMVTEEYVDDNGVKRKRVYYSDPYKEERERLRSLIEQKKAELESLQKQLQALEAYKIQCDAVISELLEAINSLRQLKTEMSEAGRATRETTKRLSNYVDRLEQCLYEYERCHTSYNYPNDLKQLPIPKRPTRRVSSLFTESTYHTYTAGTKPTVISPLAPTQESAFQDETIPDTVQRISHDPVVIKVVGCYEEKETFVSDLHTLINTWPEFELKFSKKTKTNFGFASAPKDIYACLENLGFEAKRTAFGTRFEDMDGCVYYQIKSKKE